MHLQKRIRNIDIFLIWSFIIGLLPAVFVIHIIPVDFSGFYFLALSFLKHHEYAYQIITDYCGNPLNSGLNARAPLIPFFMAISIGIFNRTLLGIYLPFFLARILILPLTYLVAKEFLPKRFALIAAFLLLFIPKLQTYSFGSVEADVFVALFYLFALYFYFKFKHKPTAINAVAIGISLGLGALTKSTGFAIAIGFILSLVIERIISRKPKWNKILLTIIYFAVLIGPFLFWTYFVHKQLYITTQHDKSLSYIPVNLPSLAQTLPLYLGLQFAAGVKALLISIIIFVIWMLGIVRALTEKKFVLILPTIISLIAIATLETCVIGYNIPGNYEFITILGFTMIPSVILLVMGIFTILSFIKKRVRKNYVVVEILIIILFLYKMVNNFFALPYSMTYTGSEYYITLKSVLENKEQIEDVKFKQENGLRIFQKQSPHRFIRDQFRLFAQDPFSSTYKQLVISVALVTTSLFIVNALKKEA